ncbi:glycerol-3-phosphate dehydrogenase/oxidase [Paenibacillus rigui]|uniref:Glycerol-3-phosphate dehydrogenase n=1 Tax=Paenibacillus rigui TaxID=554312 RepID=A0A229UV31_9BACL|nr:FAD-dependent oxidoreductase [Paenibacillus rigui]OXM87262.1 glycerol-3-phosphate dehydrogenase [Paenibacillus rigui]
MTTNFSAEQRHAYLQEMAGQTLDLLVIGGGITGAGIALDAQTRGLKTGLIEMQDFGAGTSSRSTKLIHGGLRYLKQLEFKIVAEVGKERAIVYENAPHVTTPVWMLLPIIEGGTYGKLATSVGLLVYDFLAGVRKKERRIMLSREKTLKMEPLLRTDKLKGGGYYVEYRTDDARLTIETMKEAVRRGVKAVNYAKADDLLYDDKRTIVGVKVTDQLTGESVSIHAKKIVNAAGPWVDTIREIDGSKQGKRLHLTKGVHLVVDGKRFPLQQAIYFDTPDGRMVFAIPRNGKTYIGTTDTNYTGNITHPRMTVEDRDYILRAANFMFPKLALTPKDVESSWSGLRPLIHEDGKSPSELSRKDEIFVAPSGLITIAGGKLTGYRKMAERIVDLVASQLQQQGHPAYPGCTTDRVKLSGGDVGGSQGYASFVKEKVRAGQSVGLTEAEALTLVERYGSNVDRVLELYTAHQEEAQKQGLSGVWFASLLYGIESEMVLTPVDFFVRRTGAVYFNIHAVERWKQPVLAYMAQRFGWSDEQTKRHADELDRQLRDATEPLSAEQG